LSKEFDSLEDQEAAAVEAHNKAVGSIDLPLEMAPQPGFEKGKVSTTKVIKSYEKLLGNLGRPTPIRTGRMGMTPALGFYKPKNEIIRLKEANNIAVGAHEIFHGVQKVLFGATKSGALKPVPRAAFKELVQLGKDLYGNRRPGGGYATEGFAEFGRYYLTRDKAQAKAPEMYKYFTETFLPANPEFAKGLEKAKELTDTYRFEGAENRASANMSRYDIRKRMKELSTTMRQTSTQLIDEATPLIHLTRDIEALTGTKLKPGEDPAQVYSYLRGNAQAKTHYMVFDGMVDAAGNRTGPALADSVAVAGRIPKSLSSISGPEEHWSDGRRERIPE
jgi:hypothetical protein